MSRILKNQFGGAVQKAVDAVVNEGATNISVADAGSMEAFLDAWTRALAMHSSYLRAKQLDLEAPVVLVYVSDSSKFASNKDWARQPMLGTAPTDHFAGILAVGTAEIGGFVHSGRFTNTDEISAKIKQYELGMSLTIALTSKSKLIIWPGGINGGLAPHQRDLDDGPVVLDLAAIETALGEFYETSARQTTTWWSNAAGRVTVADPERTVQNDLWHFLLGKYSTIARVKLETKIGNGRSDLLVLPISSLGKSAVLELKTTRDVSTPKNPEEKPRSKSLKANLKWVCSGVQQTVAYRDDEKLDGAFLCVYDFCKNHGKDIDDAIQSAAVSHNVIAKRYWITASHEEHREERYPL